MRPRALPAVSAILCATLLSACMPGPMGADARPGSGGGLAPPVPKDERSHGMFQQMTGINGDAVSAISGNAAQSYVYFDFFAANKAAVKEAPAKLCSHYGKALKSSRVTEPADREPGLKVLVVDCR